jgi:hypothetical protein
MSAHDRGHVCVVPSEGASAERALSDVLASLRAPLVVIGPDPLPPGIAPRAERVALGQPPLRESAFQMREHARSHAIHAAILGIARERGVKAVFFARQADAFTSATARALTGALGSSLLAVGPADEPTADPTTREQLLTSALAAEAIARVDAVVDDEAPPEIARLPANRLGAWIEEAQPRAAPAQPLELHGPLVSVIVPHYNLGQLLPDTVASIAASSYRDLEIVVVDDGSTDADSVAAFERLEAPNLRLFRKDNGGLASARNAGLALAKGELILPLDADDLITRDYVATAVRAHAREPDLAFVTCYASFFRQHPGDMDGEGYVPVGLHPPSMLLGNYASTCSAVIRRSALDAVGGYDESWPSYEDWDVWCSMAERGMKSATLPEIYFHYRWRRESMLRTTAQERDRALRARMIRKHTTLARDHAADALIAHLAVTPQVDARRTEPKPGLLERWSKRRRQ